MKRMTFMGAATLGLVAFVCGSGACSSNAETHSGSGNARPGSEPGSGTGAGGEDLWLGSSGGDQAPGPESACVATSAEANLTQKPVDIIFIVDNSGSMENNIISVQKNINENFASIIGKSGVDYRVIMLSQHGSATGDESICVQSPLSKTSCSPLPTAPALNPPLFYHYSLPISSYNSLCQFFDAYKGGAHDEYGLAPKGISEWLRPEAFKVFVEITDDGMSCGLFNDKNSVSGGVATAEDVDKRLLALDPAQFGSAEKRNYIFHSIAGVSENNPQTAAWQPGDPIQDGHCSTAVNPGTGYQALSVLTGGLRFPICRYEAFDVVFKEIAKGIVEGAKLACELPLPEPPEGEALDLSTVVMEYTPSGTKEAQSFTQVPSEDACKSGAFYISGDVIKLCPETCSVVENDTSAKLNVLFGCSSTEVVN